MNFTGKKDPLRVFKYSNHLPSYKKPEKPSVIPEKSAELTDGWTDRQTERKR